MESARTGRHERQDGKDGLNGTDGEDGQDGVSITTAPEPAGPNCANGGSKLTSASGASYVCNGEDGSDGKDGSNGAPWDIVQHNFGALAPGVTSVLIEPCPAGDILLGGTFDQTGSSTLTLTSAPAGPGVNAWRYDASNSPTASGAAFPYHHSYLLRQTLTSDPRSDPILAPLGLCCFAREEADRDLGLCWQVAHERLGIVGRVPDAHFEHPRLVAIYDVMHPDRRDLDLYIAMAEELSARRVLDLGCGTGTLALRLAERGVEVVGVDPAAGSLRVAQSKAGADRVRWIQGDATALPSMQADLATMSSERRAGDRRSRGFGSHPGWRVRRTPTRWASGL